MRCCWELIAPLLPFQRWDAPIACPLGIKLLNNLDLSHNLRALEVDRRNVLLLLKWSQLATRLVIMLPFVSTTKEFNAKLIIIREAYI